MRAILDKPTFIPMSKFSLYTILGLFICAAGAAALYPYLHQKTTEAIVREGAPGDAPYAQSEAGRRAARKSGEEKNQKSSGTDSDTEPIQVYIRDDCSREEADGEPVVKCGQKTHEGGVELNGWGEEIVQDGYSVAAARTEGHTVLYLNLYSKGRDGWDLQSASIESARNTDGNFARETQVEVDFDSTENRLVHRVAVIVGGDNWQDLHADSTRVKFTTTYNIGDFFAVEVPVDSAIAKQAAYLMNGPH